MRNVLVGGRGRGVCVCVLCWLKKKKKGEQEWEWPAKEWKEGVGYVMGSGVRWVARGNQRSDCFFFFFFNWWDVPKALEHPVFQNMTFHIPSHPTTYIRSYQRFNESFKREFWERNPRENKIDSSTIITLKTLQISLLFSSPLSNPWEAHYQNIFSPYPFLWEGYLVHCEAVRREPISH